MAKKRNPTTTVTLQPLAPDLVTGTPRPRLLRARTNGETHTLINGALDLGLVPGDEVVCTAGENGVRHFSGIARLREGTLAQVTPGGHLCRHHFAEFVDQVKDDLRIEGASSVHERGGTVRSFWPPEVSYEDVSMAVQLSASEFGLPFSLLPERLRPQLIAHSVRFGVPPGNRSAA